MLRPTVLFMLSAILSLAPTSWAQQSSSLQDAPSTPQQDPTTESDSNSLELSKAETAILAKDWKTAEPILDSWIANHPTDPRALFDAGYLADVQGRNEDAIGLYHKALDANPKSFEAQISLGLLLARVGKPEEARSALETATTMDPGEAGVAVKGKAWRAMAQIDLDGAAGKPDPAQASIDLLEALKVTPEKEEDTLLAARIAEAQQEPAGAEAAYRRLLKINPESDIAVAGLAHLLIAGKKYADAEPLLQTAVQKSPDNPALTAQLASVFVAEDKTDALPLLQQFHAKHPGDASITRMLAQVLADAGQYADSDALYIELLAKDAKDSNLLAGHGQNLIRLHQYSEAQKAFESATEVDDANGEAWNGLAFSSFQTHQPEITIHALTVRSKYLPESASIYFLWATAYDTLHDKKQAAAYYHKFLESARGQFPDQEWQARERLKVIDKAS